MPIEYHPHVGEVLWCDFTGIEPEMVKRRLVIVVSPKAVQRHHLVTVIPISATAPQEVQQWHHKLERDPLPNGNASEVWAKCDMISVVCFERLMDYHYRWNGRRTYRTLNISLNDLRGVRKGILYGLGMGGIDVHIDT